MLVLLLIKHNYYYHYEFEFKLEFNSNIIKIINFAEDKHMVFVPEFMPVSIEQFQIKLISLKLLIINEFTFVMIQHY